MIVTSVQIKTAKTQKHLYCPVFTEKAQGFFLCAFSFCIYEFVWRDSNSSSVFLQKQPPLKREAGCRKASRRDFLKK